MANYEWKAKNAIALHSPFVIRVSSFLQLLDPDIPVLNRIPRPGMGVLQADERFERFIFGFLVFGLVELLDADHVIALHRDDGAAALDFKGVPFVRGLVGPFLDGDVAVE